MSEKKTVKITIVGTQYGEVNPDNEKIKDVYDGIYYETDGKKYILYDELLEGATKPNKCFIKIGINEVTVSKKGAVNSEMIFKVGKKKLSNYETPYGGITMGIRTKNLTIDEKKNKIKIMIDYGLDMNYEFVADCTIDITVEDK